jgi:hypothetical protein
MRGETTHHIAVNERNLCEPTSKSSERGIEHIVKEDMYVEVEANFAFISAEYLCP